MLLKKYDITKSMFQFIFQKKIPEFINENIILDLIYDNFFNIRINI